MIKAECSNGDAVMRKKSVRLRLRPARASIVGVDDSRHFGLGSGHLRVIEGDEYFHRAMDFSYKSGILALSSNDDGRESSGPKFVANIVHRGEQ